MNSSHDGDAQPESRLLEMGTQSVRACRAGLSRQNEVKAEAQHAKAGSRLHGRKNSCARANGFSPRLFGFVGKS